MTVPIVPNFPESFDNDDNLYHVHDSVRLVLSEDYEPGNRTIKVKRDPVIYPKIPSTGKITLTEQCNKQKLRAVSFHYQEFDLENNEFTGITILPGFEDALKQKEATSVTLNVMASDHNNIKDSLVAIQAFAGVKGTIDNEPFGVSLEGRINFLRQIVLKPKAWFSSDVKTGNVPLSVNFKNQSFRLGTDGAEEDAVITWDFGDGSTETQNVRNLNDFEIVNKIYHTPGIYTVKLKVQNDYGEDEVIFEKLINARVKAPNPAIIKFNQTINNQRIKLGVPPEGPYQVEPQIRTSANVVVESFVPIGENVMTPGRSFGGELLNSIGIPVDPIVEYQWTISDDLQHPNNSATRSVFSIGGIYDLKLKTKTQFNAYRTTIYKDCIDVVEDVNLWLWTINSDNIATSYEYGLISETFKLTSATSINITRDPSFLQNEANSDNQIKEFKRNVGFSKRGTINSGKNGTAMIYYASGRDVSDSRSNEEIKVLEFNGFDGTYIVRNPIQREWNWANLNSPSGKSYFVFGSNGSVSPFTSVTNNTRDTLSLSNFTTTSVTMNNSNFFAGASELLQNPSEYNDSGESNYGHYSTYRTAWKDQSGFIARNDAVGPFFRIKSFYRTEGTIENPFTNIRKLQDIQGPAKIEGDLINLSSGLYFMNNTGSISKYDDLKESWQTGGSGVNSNSYRLLHDNSVIGFDKPSNTFLLSSDEDKRAYISFDYSSKAFLKFNEVDLSFKTLSSRPSGEQWLLGIF